MRGLIPRSKFLSAATSSASVSSRNVPRIALTCTRAFGADADDNQKRRLDKDITHIYKQNQIWKKEQLEEDEDFFSKLGSGHSPDYMWIGK
jgi:hypothetical protein